MRVMIVSLLIASSIACTSMQAPAAPASECVPARELAGGWTTSGGSQFGPARSTTEFRCDCSFTRTTRFVFARVTEHGWYRVERDRIRLFHADTTSTATWTFEGDALLLREMSYPAQRYTRSKTISCSGPNR
jgi:hypothetical protein